MSDGKKLSGQQYDPVRGIVLRFTEQMVDYNKQVDPQTTGFEGNPGTEITPIDAAAAKVRETDVSGTNESLDDLFIQSVGTIPRIDLPNVLTAVVVTFSTANGTGVDSHPASQQNATIYGTGSGSLSPESSAQGSASVVGDIQIEYTEFYAQNVPYAGADFFMSEDADLTAVLARLSTAFGASVLAWPHFKPVAHTFIIKGGQVSVSAKASTRVYGGGSLDSGSVGYEWGNGYSFETGTSIKAVRIPPMLHGTITLTGTTASVNASASANASTPVVFAGTDVEQAAISNTVTQTLAAAGSISPTTLSATSPATIPTSGLYLYELVPGASFYDRVSYSARVVDMSYFA